MRAGGNLPRGELHQPRAGTSQFRQIDRAAVGDDRRHFERDPPLVVRDQAVEIDADIGPRRAG